MNKKGVPLSLQIAEIEMFGWEKVDLSKGYNTLDTEIIKKIGNSFSRYFSHSVESFFCTE